MPNELELRSVEDLRLAIARLERQLLRAEDKAADAILLIRLLVEKRRRLEAALRQSSR